MSKSKAPKERKKYLDMDVLQAAKNRINHIIDVFDTILVCFSGGKDSLVVLKMSDIVHKLVNDYGIPFAQVCNGIGARKDEVELLLMDNVFQQKGITEETKYSQAWIPNK